MTKLSIRIEDNIPIPKRTANFGPRESQYDFIESMKVGQSFMLPITARIGQSYTDKQGVVHNLTPVQDAQKQAAQKQSYLAAYARRRGIKLVSRYFPDHDEYGPHVRVWHDGVREADDGLVAQGAEDGAVDLD